MKEKLIKLLSENNSKDNGILISLDIEKYVEKILTFSTIITYFFQGELKAFISYYNNDSNKQNAYLSMILVSPEIQGRSIGRILLETTIKDLESAGFKTYSLEVLKSNLRAINLYVKYGFERVEDRGELWLMKKILNSHITD